jgi:peptidoglycan hydrolase-like protein with peptidoglycan-binding domain
MFSGLIALRPASDFFREAKLTDSVDAASEAPPSPASRAASARPSYAAPEAPVLSASVLSLVDPAPRGVRETRIDDEGELIVAIKKELTRLGYYDGPIGARWDGGARRAVRRFTAFKGSEPTQALLTALRAAKPAGRRDFRAVAVPVRREPAPEAAPAGVLSDGYLPPLEIQDKAAAAQSPQPGGDALQEAAKMRRAHARNRERIASVRTRRRPAVSAFSWPF